MKTKYRTLSNEVTDFLQYEEECLFLFFWIRKRWRYVPVPCRDAYDFLASPYETLVCERHDATLKEFVQKWPDIGVYLAWAKKEQDRLDREVAGEEMEKKKRVGLVKYLS